MTSQRTDQTTADRESVTDENDTPVGERDTSTDGNGASADGSDSSMSNEEALITTDVQATANDRATRPDETVLEARNLDVYYGTDRALDDVSIEIPEHKVTAIIGPSGCGKSTFLRCINRMNDQIDAARVDGELYFRGKDVYDDDVDPVALRRKIGQVFQKPNPFPKSIRENVVYGLEVQGKSATDEDVERALRGAALWDEVEDKLDSSGLDLSGGQQQRLCIARAIAPDPEVLLMDEPTSALDPVASSKIEDLIADLVEEYTVVIVTHNMQQAARISDKTAVFLTGGKLVEFDDTSTVFEDPADDRVEDYITGKFG